MRRVLGHIIAISAVLIGGFASSAAESATPGAGVPEAGKPLGTLWYPGPYRPPAPGKPSETMPAPVLAPAPRPAPSPPARVQVPSPPPVGAPRPDKPLGTLWYPGTYDPKAPALQPRPAPVLDPAPPAPQPRPYRRPLGTLWHPGIYDPDAPIRPVPIPEIRPQPAVGPGPTAGPGPAAPVPRPPDSDLDRDLPVHLSADEMSYDQERGLITATGRVRVIHGDRQLTADKIVYDQKTDVVSATGNIALREPGGEIIFGEHMEVSGDLKDAIVETIGIILTDRSRIAATGARRSDARITEMRKGVYSPCNLCQDEPERPPLWQIKAVKIVHDKDRKIIEYRDAWLEVYGFPVAYTPYFAHPDPTVKRQSGFLAPQMGGSSDLGFTARIPYYFNLSPQADATVTALITADEGSGAVAEYRRRFQNGTLDMTASLVGGDSEDDVRGHIESEGRFDINDTWRWGFDVNRATDDTYLRRYAIPVAITGDSLDSRLFAEGFRERNYFAVNAYSFQGLRADDDSGQEPLVLPLIDYNHLGRPDRFGGQTVLDVNLLSLTRDEGSDTRRLSIRPGWQLPFVGPLGDLYKLSLGVNADLYHVDDLARSGKTSFSGFSHRLTPQAMLDWRFPLVKQVGTVGQVIEPIVVAVYSPYGGNSVDIPNEDSRELEFDDTNLFSANKFSGVDRVEGGPRINYGLKWGVFGKEGGSSTFFIGQTWRPKSDDTFAIGSGLDEKFSDVVARVSVTPGPHLNLVYRTRFDSGNFSPRRNEVSFSAGVPALRVNANYTSVDQQQQSEFPGREEINFSAASQLNRFWRVNVSGVHDLAAGEARSLGASLTYENECVVFTSNLSRTFFVDRDIEPTDQISFRVVLKTLGEVKTGFSAIP